MKLDEAVAIVTGAARGIGAAIAAMFVADGAQVVVADVLDEPGETFASRLGERATFMHLDVSNQDHWESAVSATEHRFGPVSALVNNAGVVAFGTIQDQSPESFRHVLDVNLYGAWLGMHMVLPSMRRTEGGCVVNVSSTAGLMGYANVGAYTASKWGLRGLTKTAALELAVHGIRVCSVHPGPIRTPMTERMDEAVVAAQPIPRFGQPDEVARMVRFIVVDATYSTGSEFVVDGGAATGITPEVTAPD